MKSFRFILSLHIFIFLSATNSVAELTVDTSDRDAVITFYQENYCPGDNTDSDWSGDVGSGNEGTVSNAFEEVTLQRINFFRAMAGVSGDIIFRSDWNGKCRKAGLMMSANDMLSHFPDTSWDHYSMDGAEAAAKSNLSLGSTGPQSVSNQMRDRGASNYPVGHRRWILYRPATEMGFGGVDPLTQYRSSGCVWVIQENPNNSAPVKAVPWPPEGFVPYPLIYDRWSFSYPNADFSSATVTVMKGAASVPVTLETFEIGFGDNTLVWTIDDEDEGTSGADVTYTVMITGVSGMGVPASFTYSVTQIDAESSGTKSIVINTSTRVDSTTGTARLHTKPRNSAGCFLPSDQTIQLLYSSSSASSGFSVVSEIGAGGTIEWSVSTVGYWKARIKGEGVESNVVQIKANGTIDDGIDDSGSGGGSGSGGNSGGSTSEPISVSSEDSVWSASLTKKITIDCMRQSGSDDVMTGSLSSDETEFTPDESLTKKQRRKLKRWKSQKRMADSKKLRKRYTNKIKKLSPAARIKACQKALST